MSEIKLSEKQKEYLKGAWVVAANGWTKGAIFERELVSEIHPRLNLTIKKQWFDMIASGVKREEYRLRSNRVVDKAYWEWHDLPPERRFIILRNGYSMSSPAILASVKNILWRSDYSGNLHQIWGEPEEQHYAICIGGIIAAGSYKIVTDFIKATNKKLAQALANHGDTLV